MLGFEDQHITIIKQPFASEIRDKLKRYANGEFTNEEIKQMKRSEYILSKYSAKWLD